MANRTGKNQYTKGAGGPKLPSPKAPAGGSGVLRKPTVTTGRAGTASPLGRENRKNLADNILTERRFKRSLTKNPNQPDLASFTKQLSAENAATRKGIKTYFDKKKR